MVKIKAYFNKWNVNHIKTNNVNPFYLPTGSGSELTAISSLLKE